MAKASPSPTGFDLVVERVQNKFPHFLLGITFLIVVVIAFSLLFRSNNPQEVDMTAAGGAVAQASPTATAGATATPEPQKSLGSRIAEFFMPKPEEDTTGQPVDSAEYTVKSGEGLWDIAEAQYKDGFQWKRIADANKLTAPYTLEVGQKLLIPEGAEPAGEALDTVTPVVSPASSAGETTQEAAMTGSKVTISGNAYVVKEGDCLWTIAESAYGDGFMYAKIVQANNVTNPSLIYPGQRFVLPRN